MLKVFFKKMRVNSRFMLFSFDRFQVDANEKERLCVCWRERGRVCVWVWEREWERVREKKAPGWNLNCWIFFFLFWDHSFSVLNSGCFGRIWILGETYSLICNKAGIWRSNNNSRGQGFKSRPGWSIFGPQGIETRWLPFRRSGVHVSLDPFSLRTSYPWYPELA